MTKISQLSDIGASLAADDEFVIRDVSDGSTPNKKVTSSGFLDYVISQGAGSGFSQIAAGVGPLARVQTTSSGVTGTITFSTAAATTLIERARIDSSGRLLIGTSSDITGSSAYLLQVVNTSFAQFALGRSDGTTSGDTRVGRIAFYSNAGSVNEPIALIDGVQDGTSGSGDKPGRLVFSTTADGASSPTERCRITAAGRLLVGTSTSGNSLLQLAGALGLKGAAIASSNTAGDFSFEVTGLTALSGASNQQAGILFYHRSSKADLGANITLLASLEVRGSSTYSNLNITNIVGTTTASLTASTSSGFTVTIDVDDASAGAVFAVVIGGGGTPSISITA
jgi:hypothetical protein